VRYRNVHVKGGDGYLGWPDKGPFDAVVVTCGAKELPQPLFEQLKPRRLPPPPTRSFA
jgi:protein-L-isoaspartate(D-aspartate) O-methyltransferase